jgi:hypothetical protein
VDLTIDDPFRDEFDPLAASMNHPNAGKNLPAAYVVESHQGSIGVDYGDRVSKAVIRLPSGISPASTVGERLRF